MLYERADQCESKADDLDGLADEYEGLEEPDDPGEMEEPKGDEDTHPMAWAAFEAWQEAHDEYQTALNEYEAEKERIIDEAGALIEDMPE